ncbi:MAG: UDP-N-acetylmuramoyl-tripeptide--D-alanyl-D-alanine ligase [Raoultibacter sp.]
MRLNAKQICEYTGGTLVVEPIDASKLIYGVTWDSRNVVDADLYVALPGERADGHDFIAAALRRGARAILVMQKPDEPSCALAREMGAAVIEVASTSAAVTDLARAWRRHLRGRVLALTGSTGKTTTKNLVRDVLAARFSVVATKGNQNNELGVPKTLLSADPETDVVVVEMGMRGLGQLEELCDFVCPDWGLVTNVGKSHIELLGSRENIARAKAELITALPSGTGRAFLNASDDFTDLVCEVAEVSSRDISVCRFDGSGSVSTSDGIDVFATNVYLDAQGKPHFMLHTPEGDAPCILNLRGLHNVHNACAAAAVGVGFGMDVATIAHALNAAQPETGRQEILQSRDGCLVINDAYNANPDSMRASLLMFDALDVSGRRFAVLGDMGELGDFSQACHEDIGELAATLHLDYLVCIGKLAGFIASAARSRGMSADTIFETQSIAQALTELEMRLEPKDAVLVKASHSMGLERIVGGLVN